MFVFDGRGRTVWECLLLELAVLEVDVGSLELVETDKDKSTGEATEDVRAGTLEEGGDTLLLEDHVEGADRRLVLVGVLATRNHHHAATDGVDRVRGDTGDGGHGVAEAELGEKPRSFIIGATVSKMPK